MSTLWKLLVAAILFISISVVVETRDTAKVVCYVSSRSKWRKGDGRFTVMDINPKLCTHIVYTSAYLDARTYSLTPANSSDQLDYIALHSMKENNPHLNLLLGIGAWSGKEAKDFYEFLYGTKSSDWAERFADLASSFVKNNGFGGLVLNWELVSHERDIGAVSTLVIELGKCLRANELTFSVVVSGRALSSRHSKVLDSWWSNIDEVHLMTYDFLIPNGLKFVADYQSPLKIKRPSHTDISGEKILKSWVSRGMKREKLILGIPTFGISWNLLGDTFDPPTPATWPGRMNSSLLDLKGYLGYNEICNIVRAKGWVSGSSPNMGSFAYRGSDWIGFEEPWFVRKKAKYVWKNRYGGVAFSDLSMDDFRGVCTRDRFPLVRSAKKVLMKRRRNKSSSTVEKDAGGHPKNRIRVNEKDSSSQRSKTKVKGKSKKKSRRKRVRE